MTHNNGRVLKYQRFFERMIWKIFRESSASCSQNNGKKLQ